MPTPRINRLGIVIDHSVLVPKLTIRHIAAILSIVITLLFGAGSSWAEYNDAVAAYERGDYVTAAEQFRSLAEKGSVKAQFNLGFMYNKGEGVIQNDEEALKWFSKAAEQGSIMAQYRLGEMYFRGEGVSQNYTEAVKWFHKAAQQGDSYAQVNLGFIYGSGSGVPTNFVKAHLWYSLAKAQGNPGGAKGLYLIKSEMTPAEIKEAQELATEWREKRSN